ncbi:Bifunctional transcriptional activator/DNA repair enzyme Ada [Marinomonas aquimarina]|uniref:methylated-DNA--[protein]-cysteine S-methyltransferase n=1 Tax=Marinomonas aquimarina TaxID=295068 RepID=A0A1A8T7Z7_9GAMM|nr:methylated-DNA--[protein]-cysteine S-methyltransferase [Marinomonas aquimarina]SBS28740.1 Bifunctional transcriptional activator/DNA repair enzyme Ada [Marinomonas aquimarina]
MSDSRDYQRIQQAIEFIVAHKTEQPSLEAIAQSVHLSPFHFQRMFQHWAGVSPKKFMQFLSVEHAKTLLGSNKTLQQTSLEVGLSSTGRLHDLFVSIEGMTPGQYKSGGAGLHIDYQFYSTPFGTVLIAATDLGICHMAFCDDQTKALAELNTFFDHATLSQRPHPHHDDGLSIFSASDDGPYAISLHLAGTPFQIKVWQSLLSIPLGGLSNYAQIAHAIDQPTAARAVGSAIAKNPIAYIIPCHRVIRNTGELGNYRWGSLRKNAIIGWEAAQLESERNHDE